MDAQKRNAKRAQRRKFRVRKSVRGSADFPRLSVFRSNFHIYVQLIDDEAQVTLASASTVEKDAGSGYGGNVAAAATVGKLIAERAKEKGITKARFDRGSYRYHGRIKALARAATENGLVCTSLEEKVKRTKAPVEDPKAKKAKAKAGA